MAALVLAAPVVGAGGTDARTAAEGWRGAFEQRAQVDLGRRMIVVLAAPSLADRVAASGRLPGPKAERRLARQADLLQSRLLAVLRQRGVRIERELSFTRTLNGFSAVLDARAVAALEAEPAVAGVYPVRAVYPASTPVASPPQSGLEPSVSLPGADGDGVTVALLDTGVDRSHPVLRGRVLRGIDLVAGDRDASPEPRPGDATEVETHGTRMAGILAGIAPGATVLPIRVLGWMRALDGGYHVVGRGDVLVAGLERAVDPNGDGDVRDAARIALAPLIEPYAAFADSPEARAVAGALELGTLVVAAAGNDGPAGAGFGTVGAPGGAAAALTVGAADLRETLPIVPGWAIENPDAGRVAAFSSRGPAFDSSAKPDVVAAGVGLATAEPGLNPDGTGRSVTATGSSAAAAVAAAAAALVAQARPELDAATLRSVLVGSARPLAPGGLAEPSSAQGAGLVDPAAARVAVLVIEPATVALARAESHGRQAAGTVRVRNLSQRTLRVSVEIDPDAASPLVVSARPARLTLRPGAAREVRVSMAGGRNVRSGTASGVLVVRAAGVAPARVPWTVSLVEPVRLVGDLGLSRRSFAPSDAIPAVLSFRAGWAGEGPGGVVIEPVGFLEVELWTRGGKRLGVLARLRDLLPGRYAVGLTGRGPDGRLLEPGRYVVRLRAQSVDGGEGDPRLRTVAAVRFAVRPPAR